MTTLTQVPEKLLVGDSWAWTRSLADYPATTWTATWRFANATHNFSVTGTASGSAHAGAATASTTGAYTAGEYRWQLSVASGSTRYTLEEGWVTLLPNPTAGNYDHRTHARKVLDAIEAVLESRATQDQQSMSIGGRSLSRTPINELLVLADRYRAMVRAELDAERLALGRPTRNRVLARFTR